MITNDTASFLDIIEEAVKHVQDAETHMAFLMRGGTAKGLFGALKYGVEKRLYVLTPAESERASALFDAFVFTSGFWTSTVAKPIPKAAKNPFRAGGNDASTNLRNVYRSMFMPWFNEPDATSDEE